MRFLAVVSLALTLLLLVIAGAHAQSGSCPDYTHELGYISGFYPTLKICDDGSQSTERVMVPGMPCEVGIRTRHAYVGEQPGVYVIFPNGQVFPSGHAKVSFFASGLDILGRRRAPDLGFIVESFNGSGVKIGQRVITTVYPVAEGEFIELPNGDRLFLFPNSGVPPLTLPAVAGGYLRIRENVQNWSTGWEMYGLVVVDANGYAPSPCNGEIPNYNTPTPTHTLAPTDTPAGPTATATNTPTATSTPWAFPSVTPVTSTPTAWPTRTPQPLHTMPVPPTPTPMPTLELSTIVPPAIDPPSVGGFDTPEAFDIALTPNATTEARLDDMATVAADGGAIATRWYTSTQSSLGWMGTGVTNTTGISSPVQIASELSTNLTAPIRYAKAVGIYVPNLWPIILFLLLATIWIFFVLIVKYGIAIVAETAEVLRKLIELFPGM